ncbi:MAG: glycosyltransferase family 2 protein [Desulfococcaceae bacterium]|jgi:GT2 family glycosyltransferase|nr:glycosyltransferase family 2 protein [Desulfococcaceae bacterium]
MKTLAIIVNYKSAPFTLQAVHSIIASESAGRMKIVIIDNSEDSNEIQYLRNALPASVTLLVNPENIGFGAACNAVFGKYDSDTILLLNPDARLLPGALLRMQRTLYASEKIGAVGPQIFWDDNLKYYLPPSYPPLLFFLQPCLSALGHGSALEKMLNCFWRSYALRIWRTKIPQRVYNLSGGHCLIKKQAVEKAGGLFDPRFFLYFEDTDLFLRLRKKGYLLMVEPGAGVVHYYDQCARDEYARKRELMTESYKMFMEKHRSCHSFFLKSLLKHMKSAHAPCSGQKVCLLPFSVKIPEDIQKRWLFEWSPNPNFLPAVGCFGKGAFLYFSSEEGKMLSPGHYYARITNPDRILAEKTVRFSWTVG